MSVAARAISVAGVALLALVLAGLGCCRRDAGRTVPPTLAALAREVGVSFPPSARLLGVQRQAGIDALVRFKVAMAADDVAPFLAASPVKPDAFESGEGGLLGADQDFWDPSHAVRLRTGQAIVANHRALNLGVADGSAGRAFIYVVCHGT